MNRLHMLLTLGLIAAMAAPAAAIGAAEQTPDQVLASKGLTKVGFYYLLDPDVKLIQWLRITRATQHKIEDAMKRRANLQRDVEQGEAVLQQLDAENQELTAALHRIDKRADGTYNFQVDRVNAVRAKERACIKLVEQRQSVMQGLGDPADEYVKAVVKLSEMTEAVVKQYAALAADKDVQAALDRINSTSKAKFKFGPSQRFAEELPATRKLCQTVNSAMIQLEFDGGVPHVLVTVNGSVQTPMIVDSGAALVTLSSEMGEKLGLHPGDSDRVIKLLSADGAITEAHVYVLKSVRVGNFTLQDVECAVQPPSVKGADNLLGGTFLRHFVYKMDLAAGVLRISEITDDLNPSSKTTGPPPASDLPAVPPPPSDDQPRIKIVSAKWGGGKHWADVTDQLVRQLSSGHDIWANPKTLGADPTPGWRKHLQIDYVIEGQRKTVWFDENAKIDPAKLLGDK